MTSIHRFFLWQWNFIQTKQKILFGRKKKKQKCKIRGFVWFFFLSSGWVSGSNPQPHGCNNKQLPTMPINIIKQKPFISRGLWSNTIDVPCLPMLVRMHCIESLGQMVLDASLEWTPHSCHNVDICTYETALQSNIKGTIKPMKLKVAKDITNCWQVEH